jgi:hypothetical protein
MRNGVLAVLALALLGAAFLAGLMAGNEDTGRGGLRVNGSEVVANVWELYGPRGGQPPQCRPETDDGIGAWRCTLFRPPRTLSRLTGLGPISVAIEVGEDGSIRSSDGRACCIEVND